MTGEFLRPSQAARVWPHTGRPPHPSKIVRAIVRGTRSHQRPSERIKLRALRDSQGWLTTENWISEFVAALTADRGGSAPLASVQVRAQEAMGRLRANGW